MRWIKPEGGDKRTRTKFLIFPKCCVREYRWLEKGTWKEEYHHFHKKWICTAWVDGKEETE